jgi:hypothetical protein
MVLSMMENGSRTLFGKEYGMKFFGNYNEFISHIPYNLLIRYCLYIQEDYSWRRLCTL